LAAQETSVTRWRSRLHEAGHAVAGHRLLKRTVMAAVYEDGVGAAYLDIKAAIPRTFEEALAIAAGPAVEALADVNAPPQELPPAPPLTATHPEAVAPLVAQLRQSPRDAEAIARWCIRGIEDEPERRIKRFHWIRRQADLFVTRNQQEIVDVAAGLYERGVITLEAEPVRPTSPGVPHRVRQHSRLSPSRSRRPEATRKDPRGNRTGVR
jgi:hypothetical protein